MRVVTALVSLFLLAEALPAADAPPPEFAGDFGSYKSPLKFNDGKPVRTAADWTRRRQEILATWHEMMGQWPPLIAKPAIEYLGKQHRDNFTQHRIRLEVAPGKRTVEGYLAVPDGTGPFPAVLVVFYEPETSMGLKGEMRDFALQLTRRGFVTLSIGTPESQYYPAKDRVTVQPLSMLAYVGANCYNALASLPAVDAKRVGVMGHSFGGKWAMFASCLYDKFAGAAWSDPGIVFDETRPNVNYWEPWYLGWEAGRTRKPGVPKPENPRTGPYKRMMESGHDLHELHALMAPRPFLVSGGSEDPPERWKALNHAIAVNNLLGHKHRVAMTNRPAHQPTVESNEQIYRFFETSLKNDDRAAGLAAAYPGDKGLSGDPDVLFAEDFESGDMRKWDNLRGPVHIDGDAPKTGRWSGRFEMHRGKDTGSDAIKWFMPGADTVYVRFYVKFSSDYHYNHHFVWLGANQANNKHSSFGKAGRKPDGTYYSTAMEPWFAWGKNPFPGEVNLYSYYLDMLPDPKMTDKYWGNAFFPPGPGKGVQAGSGRIIPPLDKWQCWEFMIQANTAPDKADGRQAMWVDGQLAGEFTGIRWRSDPELKVNALWLENYGYDEGDPTKRYWGDQQSVWFDDIVVAKRYVGPIKDPGGIR